VTLTGRLLLAGAIIVACTTPEVNAQTGNKFALGLDLSTRNVADPRSSDRIGVGLQWRIGHSDQGWGWKYALNWFSTELDAPVGGANVAFGELHVRPFMGGYGYTHQVRPNMTVSANLLGGYAFSTFSLEPGANDAYRDRLGAARIDAQATNTFVVKPEISTWVDVGRKIGINASLGYMVARPEVVVTSSLGEDRRRIKADTLRFKIGAVYSIF
jgi:hypothetical protein